MIKSTTKAAKTAIRSYIYQCVNDELASRFINFQTLLDEYNQESMCSRRNITLAEFMTNYSMVFDADTDKQRKLIKEWLCETDEEANKFSADDVEHLFLSLIDREFCKAFVYAIERRISNGHTTYHRV